MKQIVCLLKRILLRKRMLTRSTTESEKCFSNDDLEFFKKKYRSEQHKQQFYILF